MKFRESETLELKKSTSQLKKAIISIASILNKHQGGEVYFGIRGDGKILGQLVSEKTIRDISQAISQHIEPKIYPTIEKVKLEGRDCIIIKFSGTDMPYYAYGRAYMRVGDEDRQLGPKELENLIMRKNKEGLRWDTQPCREAKLGDISPAKLKSFLKTSGLKYNSVDNSLEKLKLISDGKPLNAAVILFGKKPQSFFPNARLRCAVFGTTNTSFTIDMQDFEGDLFHLIEKAEEYILKNIHIGMKLDGLRRVDVPEINSDAFREAIINAFCHRDYHEYDSVNIAVFKDRVEVRSPGLLYGDLTIEQIRREMVSERRNELIAELFHRVHIIEKWGRGISLILSKEPDAEFKEVGTHFITVFKRKEFHPKTTQKLPKNYPKTVEKDSEKWSERWSERWSELNENQRRILTLMMENPRISRKELSVQLGINRSAIQKHIEKLKKKGMIKRVGPAKGGHWEIKKETGAERWSEKQVEQWSEKWSELNENQRRILGLMMETPRISRKEISAKLGINQSAVQKHIEKLKKKKVLRRVGPDRGGHWEIVEREGSD